MIAYYKYFNTTKVYNYYSIFLTAVTVNLGTINVGIKNTWIFCTKTNYIAQNTQAHSKLI